MKILVVDDEKRIQDVIYEYCKIEQFEVEFASDGEEALKKLNKNNYDIMILDIMMPKMDGFEVLKLIPKSKKIPTIVLSARTDEYDKLQGFDLDIDDYLTKPFSPKELMARIKAVTKRNTLKKREKYCYQTLEIDYDGHTVKIDSKLVNLTPKEYDILVYLIENKNIAISREQLLSKIWGYDFFGDDRTIDTHIKMLRNNLGKYRNLIVTVRGLGYKYSDEEE